MRIFLLFFLIIIQLPQISLAEDDDTPSTKLSASEILEFIESERDFLRGKFKVDLVEHFTNLSPAIEKRFGNKKRVLNLKGISLSGANLSNSIFTMANLNGANLSGSNLKGADLVHVDFKGANLSNADFKGADLSNAIFESTNINGANFDGANLFGATFKKMAVTDKNFYKNLQAKTRSYVNLPREPLPEYYKTD